MSEKTKLQLFYIQKNIEHNNMLVTNNSPRKYEKGN